MKPEKQEQFDWDAMPDDAPQPYSEDLYRYHSFAARATLYPDKSDEEVQEIIEKNIWEMRRNNMIKKPIIMETDFRKELENLINKYSRENGSDTPDFILARYLDNALNNFDAAVKEREEWYGRATHLEELDLGMQQEIPFPTAEDEPPEPPHPSFEDGV